MKEEIENTKKTMEELFMSKKKEKLQKYNIMTLGNSAVGKTSFIINTERAEIQTIFPLFLIVLLLNSK